MGVVLVAIPKTSEHAVAQSQNLFKYKQLEQQGRHFLYLIRQSIRLSSDTQINAYVLGLAKKLARNAAMDSDPLTYHVVVDPAINAFAGPGATFFVNTGMIEAAASEGQLASVLAHELAHFKQNHLSRLTQNYKSTLLPSILLTLAGIAAGGEEGIAVAAGAQAAQVESMIDHTLVYEREADAVGIQILTASGYSPIEARDFMLVLERKIREQGLYQSNIHNTHPITPERVASFQARVKQYENLPDPEISEDFHFVRARVQVIFNWEPNKTYRFFEDRITRTSGVEKLAEQYGYVLSLAKDGEVEQARENLEAVRSQHPDNEWFLKAAAEIELAANNNDQVKMLLEDAALSSEPDVGVVELYTRAMIRTGDLDSASRYIRKHIGRFPDSLELYKLQSEAALKTDDDLTGYLAEVDLHYRLGDLDLAMSVLKVANQKLNDYYSKEIIKEKARVIQKEIEWRR